VKYKP